LERTSQVLGEVPERFIDEDALVQRAVTEACAGCSARENCRETRKLAQWRGNLLHKPLLIMEELPVRCRKGSRVLDQMRRAQEQLRSLQADRQLQREYRAAVVQQYDFLSRYLHSLSDGLSCREPSGRQIYDPVVAIYGNREGTANGDRCMMFSGTGNQYYIILCDGMGTGSGAVRESRRAGEGLKGLLLAGFPAEAALRSLNSFCALSDRAGAVTVDLAEVDLETGKVTIYKWGAAASWLIGSTVEKLGTPSVPPGLTAENSPEVTCRLMLRRSQLLLMVSDGLAEDRVEEICRNQTGFSGEQLARQLLQQAQQADDATVVTIQLLPVRHEGERK
jgi:serine phosphatase RsbU (regulator of sigma subunit)